MLKMVVNMECKNFMYKGVFLFFLVKIILYRIGNGGKVKDLYFNLDILVIYKWYCFWVLMCFELWYCCVKWCKELVSFIILLFNCLI